MIIYYEIKSFNDKFKINNWTFMDKDFEYIDANIKEILIKKLGPFYDNSNYIYDLNNQYKNKIIIMAYVFRDKLNKSIYKSPPKDRQDFIYNYLSGRIYIYDFNSDTLKRFESTEIFCNLGTDCTRYEREDFEPNHKVFDPGDLVLLNYRGEITLNKIICNGSKIFMPYLAPYYSNNIYTIEYVKTIKRTNKYGPNYVYREVNCDNGWHYTDLHS